MANVPSDARHPSSPPELPDLPEWMASALQWMVQEISRQVGGEPQNPWLNAEDAAAYTGIPHPTFRKLAKRIPRHHYGEQSFVYHRDELDAWLRADANRYWEDG